MPTPEEIEKHLGIDQASIEEAMAFAEDPTAYAVKLADNHAGDAAFFDVPRVIGGVPVREMTLQDHGALCLAGSPFMVGGDVYGEDVAIFLWRIATAYTPGDSPEREAFLSQIHTADGVALKGEITSYIRAMYGEQAEAEHFLPAHLHVAPIVLDIAAETGWREPDILAMPLPRAFAYLAEIKEREEQLEKPKGACY